MWNIRSIIYSISLTFIIFGCSYHYGSFVAVEAIPLSYYLNRFNNSFKNAVPPPSEEKLKNKKNELESLIEVLPSSNDFDEIANSIQTLDDVANEEHRQRATVCVYTPVEIDKQANDEQQQRQYANVWDIMFECEPDEYCCELECCSKQQNSTTYE